MQEFSKRRKSPFGDEVTDYSIATVGCKDMDGTR